LNALFRNRRDTRSLFGLRDESEKREKGEEQNPPLSNFSLLVVAVPVQGGDEHSVVGSALKHFPSLEGRT
jgi:hypothetical protein